MESIIVGLIVFAAAAFTLHRMIFKPRSGCGCGCDCSAPAAPKSVSTQPGHVPCGGQSCCCKK